MASPPVGPQPRRRAALNVEKPTKPKKALRAVSTRVQKKTASSGVTPPKTISRKKSATITPTPRAGEDAERQQVAEQIVRKIFAEAGVSPDRVTIGDVSKARSKSKSTQAGTSIKSPRLSSCTIEPLGDHEEHLDEMVAMPSNASERLISKSEALRAWYHQQFPRKVGLFCTVVGLGFSLFGGLSLIPFVGAMYPDWQSFQTALLCETLNCEQTATSESSQTDSQTSTQTSTGGATQTNTIQSGAEVGTSLTQVNTIPSPAVSFLTKPPSILTAPTTLVVRAEYVSDLRVHAESRSTGQLYLLRREGEPVGSDHTFSLGPKMFPPGEYDLRARAVALRDGKVVFVTGSRFTVESAPIVTADATATSSVDNGTSLISNTAADEVVSTTDATGDAVVGVGATNTVPLPIASTTLTLSYVRPAPGLIAITVRAADAQAVEVYAQRLNATSPVLVGQARRVEPGRWVLPYDTRSLPNGSYVLVGRVKTLRGITDTPRVPLYINNVVVTPSTASTTIPRSAVETTETVERLEATDEALPDRNRYTETLPGTESETTRPVVTPTTTSVPSRLASQPTVAPLPIDSVPEPLRPVVRASFTDNASELNDLFKRYASAVQTNDDSLRALIEDELAKKRSRIVEETIARGGEEVTASDLDQSLATEFNRLKERVETFESLLRDRSGQNSAADQDGDGISDYDEVALYDTDPAQFDTDSDGVSDGAEVMRGFNPRSSEEEAIMTYTSPKEFGIVLDDVLTVAAVTPVVETDRERGTPPVQAEIRGTGIPNSFVTLFIFSSPTVVTVRTGADGSFVYQFDKELEDGSHEVYVAVTDNTGDIIAKSNPFSFVKEAEAFTIVDAANAAPVASSDPSAAVSISQLYQVITAMVVLAFGLILLIFGIVMRREPAVIESAAEKQPHGAV